MNKPILYALLVALLSFLLLLCLGIGTLLLVHIDNAKSSHYRVAKHYAEAFDQITIFSNRLERIKSDSGDCSEALLYEMRKAQYASKEIRDIGFLHEGKLLCTTGLGVLEKPFPKTPDQIVLDDATRIWLNVPLLLFENSITGHILQKGDFNFVLNAHQFETRNRTPIKTRPYFRHHKAAYPIDGGGAIDSLPETETPPIAPDCLIRLHGLHVSIDNCLTTSHNPCLHTGFFIPEVFGHHLASIYSMLFVSLLAALLIYDVSKRRFRKYFSLSGQVRRNLVFERVICLYQPQIMLQDEEWKVIGAEALVRYIDDEGNIVSPAKFLNSIRQYHLTQKLTKIVLRHILEDCQNCFAEQRPANTRLKISINLFARDFYPESIAELFQEWAALETKPFDLAVEVVEDELIELNSTRESIQLLQQMGISVAIDDFGTGYSNLQYIKELSPDIIKIDRSFVDGIDAEGSARAMMIKSLVELLRHSGAKIVAEGIENNRQANILSDLGVEVGQGYYFGKPMKVEKVRELLHKPLR